MIEHAIEEGFEDQITFDFNLKSMLRDLAVIGIMCSTIFIDYGSLVSVSNSGAGQAIIYGIPLSIVLQYVEIFVGIATVVYTCIKIFKFFRSVYMYYDKKRKVNQEKDS